MKRTVLALVLVLAGAGMILAGVLLSGDEGVWQKAAQVCLECIGIG